MQKLWGMVTERITDALSKWFKKKVSSCETDVNLHNPAPYASAVVGRTLTNSVLVSRVFTDESAGSSGTQIDVKL